MKKLKQEKSAPILDVSNGWVKEMMAWDLIHAVALKGHSAFLLLHIIALRAWRGPGTNERGCGIGECCIGDYAKWKFTKKGYRVAKKQLEDLGLCSFRASNMGTIAMLKTKDLFDINIDYEITERAARAPVGHPRGTPGAPNKKLTIVRIEDSENPKDFEKTNNTKNYAAAYAAPDGVVAPSALGDAPRPSGDEEETTEPSADDGSNNQEEGNASNNSADNPEDNPEANQEEGNNPEAGNGRNYSESSTDDSPWGVDGSNNSEAGNGDNNSEEDNESSVKDAISAADAADSLRRISAVTSLNKLRNDSLKNPGNTQVSKPASKPVADADAESPAGIPDTEPERTPSQHAAKLAKKLTEYVQDLQRLPYLPVMNRESVEAAIEFFTLYPEYYWWDVLVICVLGMKFGRETVPPEQGVDPYWWSRHYAHKPNKIFGLAEKGMRQDDLILCIIAMEVRHRTDSEHDINWAQAICCKELAAAKERKIND